MICEQCGKNCDHDKIFDVEIAGNLISAFIDKWYCQDCKNKNTKSIFICAYGCCDNNGPKKWSHTRWIHNHISHHHYNMPLAIEMIGKKICNDIECTEIIDKSDLFCSIHSKINDLPDQYQSQIFDKCEF